MSKQDVNDKLENAVKVLQSVTPTFLPADGEVMTLVVEWPPGDPGLPPHRHPGGPCFGYVLDGEMVPGAQGARVVRAPRTDGSGGGGRRTRTGRGVVASRPRWG